MISSPISVLNPGIRTRAANDLGQLTGQQALKRFHTRIADPGSSARTDEAGERTPQRPRSPNPSTEPTQRTGYEALKRFHTRVVDPGRFSNVNGGAGARGVSSPPCFTAYSESLCGSVGR